MAKGDITRASLQANPSLLNILKLMRLENARKKERVENYLSPLRKQPTLKNKGGVVTKTKPKFKGHF
tara:strand:+ start:106 stop:306 length:201 start_codon:yes stop_codon:yes gene_type:complete